MKTNISYKEDYKLSSELSPDGCVTYGWVCKYCKGVPVYNVKKFKHECRCPLYNPKQEAKEILRYWSSL